MAASTVYSFPSAIPPLSISTNEPPQPVHSLCCQLFRPFSTSQINPPSMRVLRSNFSPRRLSKVYGSMANISASMPEPQPESDNSEAGTAIDLRLPRRSLLVQFTCDLCGERTKRLINRLAYERGVIFVQCAGCLQHHKLVDNLGLITEFDFREKTNTNSEIDQV